VTNKKKKKIMLGKFSGVAALLGLLFHLLSRHLEFK
jgi:hypothetical protein